MNNLKNITVIGTGVIGTGWILRFLAFNKKVTAYDPSEKQKNYLKKELRRTKSNIEKLYKKKINLKKLVISSKLEDAVKNADLILLLLLVLLVYSHLIYNLIV